MSALFEAFENNGQTRTDNGMKARSTTQNPLVDLFFKAGASRGKFDNIRADVIASFDEDADLAVRLLLWLRDAREGAGERQLFVDSMKLAFENGMINRDQAMRVFAKIPLLGRYKDLLSFVGTAFEDEALRVFADGLRSKDGLAFKWAPREKSANKLAASKLRKIMDMSPAQFRKFLVNGTKVVESQMAAGEWNKIDFSKVPSVATARYQKAFAKHAPAAYAAWKTALVDKSDPKVKVNAGAVYPYDIVKSLRSGDATVAQAQWDALPDWMNSSEEGGILPVVDTSGSMTWGNVGVNGITPMDAAASLGIYIAERNRGIFKDQYVTFSDRPEFIKMKGDLKSKFDKIYGNPNWGGSTNLHAVFDLMLNAAVQNKVVTSDMPKAVLIISDMQFNHCTRYDDSAIDMIRRKYADAGYDVPRVIFWNINAGDNVPAKFNETGVNLVSGLSPSIMKSVLATSDASTGYDLMLETLNADRYVW